MSQQTNFAEFLWRVRAGDEVAARELVQRFEPLIRREVRLRIGDGRLRRAFDSQDVSQSVLASFFARAGSGEYELERPEQLGRLLMTMARNRLVSRTRRERRLVRDVRRVVADPGVLDQVSDRQPTPSQLVSRKEQLERLREALSTNEHQILELRAQGMTWDEVAAKLGGNGQARRVQLSRGLKRLERLWQGADSATQ
jgi:RNA polymerase sigma factor (sigma-70 family)